MLRIRTCQKRYRTQENIDQVTKTLLQIRNYLYQQIGVYYSNARNIL